MKSGTLLGDSDTGWVSITKGPVSISVDGVFDTCTVTFKRQIDGVEFAFRAGSGGITLTAADNSKYELYTGDMVKLIVTSSGSTTALRWQVSGN